MNKETKIKFANKLSQTNFLGLKNLKVLDGRSIDYHLNRAVKNYLKQKRIKV